MSRNGSKSRLIAYICVAILIAALFSAINLQQAQAGYVRWNDYASNPVYDPAATRAYYPCVIYDAAQFSSHGSSYYYKMWYGDTDSARWEWVVYSNDGINWIVLGTDGLATVLRD